MLLKQISVFAENRRGAIMDITGVLFNAGVNLRAISIADTTDFGVVRLIVDKRKEALAALRESGMTVKETDVVALAVDDTPGAFHNALKALTESGVMVEYSYGFVSFRLSARARLLYSSATIRKRLSAVSRQRASSS